MATHTNNATAVAPMTRPWRYAVGMFGTSIPINMFVTFMAYFYIDTLGLDGRVFATVMLGYAVIDAIDNPVYSYLSDRTRSRFGRRRPWLLIGAPLLALSLFAFYSPPEQAQDGWALVAWFAAFAILTETIDSLINTNYGALLPELFPEERRRATANALRQGAMLIAMIISVALTPLVAEAIGYQRTAAVYGSLAAVVIVFTALGAHEDPATRFTPTPGIRDSIRAILGTSEFWRIAITLGTYSGASALILAGAPFFVKYALGLNAGDTTFLLASVILVAIGMLAVWVRLVHRYGPIRIWRISLAVLAASLVPMYLAGSLITAIAAGALIGVGMSGVIAAADLVVARLINLDAAKTGLRREAMFIAAFGFFNRLNALLKSLAFIAVASLYGFISGDEPGTRPDEAARFIMTVFPFALLVIATLTAQSVRVPAPARAGRSSDDDGGTTPAP
jgi:GPH family glycoside/pentoside/hexuronide:cation symporter